MRKIQTIFERDWKGNRKIIDKPIEGLDLRELQTAVATEKVDGTNIRVTVRGGQVVRVEKRRNPSKAQKQEGITEPWYVDANENSNNDKWIWAAVRGTDFSDTPDGEWSGEAYGKMIQGNPLQISGHRVFLFSIPNERAKLTLQNVPTDFRELWAWMNNQKSYLNEDAPIEGIVWHFSDGRMFKIKRKDFPKVQQGSM